MNISGNNDKLDWMYKSANNLVDREEYLLGRSVDKTLEQLNAEEKEKKLGLVPPKNHVEHECIPPSIRDFNKIVQAEQVDISAKLQEDPLVAIKKREEEARRQFLQNPVQLKKLQEALKAQELKKRKSKHKKLKDGSDSDIDSKIVKKLKYLKGDSLGVSVAKKKSKKSKDNALDTILMHKFNQLKDRLSQEDLNDILAGKVSDSDEESEKGDSRHRRRTNSSNEDSDYKPNKAKMRQIKQRSPSKERNLIKTANKRKNSISANSSSSSSSEDEKHYKKSFKKDVKDMHYDRTKYKEKESKSTNLKYKNRGRNKSLDRNKQTYGSREVGRRDDKEGKFRKRSSEERKARGEHSSVNKPKNVEADQKKEIIADDDLENRILQKLRMLRDSSKSRRESSSDSNTGEATEHKKSKHFTDTSNSSDSENIVSQNNRNDSDSDERTQIPKSFGLVKADGTKIALNKKPYEVKKSEKSGKVENVTKQDKKYVKKLTEDEKEQRRKEMMKNAEKRDKERSENLKKYREEDKREEKSASNFDKDFMHKQLLRSTKEATVESRIKSNLNNIQRSSRHMDSHFSRR